MIDDVRPGEARFDPGLGAWVLSSHADVSAALRDPRLSASGTGVADDAAHVAVREAASDALGPARLAAWRGEAEASARMLAGLLPLGVPVDLVGAFARPWSAGLAARVAGAPLADGERLGRLAREVFLEAAHATDPGSRPTAREAVAELAGRLSGAGASADVQAYVALSETLPGFLANAWLELARRPDQADLLRARPGLMPGAVEELLRHSGPARAVFRRAPAASTIGRASVAPGGRLILMLRAANRDPTRYPDPGRLDVRRDASGHLAFGRGGHSCPGAPLIRMAAGVATGVLLAMAGGMEPAGEAEWVDGFAIRAASTLPVVLRGDRPVDRSDEHGGFRPAGLI